MHDDRINITHGGDAPFPLPITWVHTLVVGSGAAGLNAAVQLHACGVSDLLILTEGLDKGTSINTGSDKQTYYKLGLYGGEPDSPRALAESYYAGGSMHGDLALVEASLSARAFLHLVALGVPFPRDGNGGFVGYKTDHDPRQRATSIGPYTSREMCRALIAEVQRRGIRVREGALVATLLTLGEGAERRCVGALALLDGATWHAYVAENVVYATGGPGGLYQTSVYPQVHTGAIGVALMAGARARNLPESQYGLASTRFRWNVSGSYMQVVPRILSTAPDGESEPREFLRPYFASVGEMADRVFLKGYQWPFDARKVLGGSSLIDILVYIETVERGRRVFLDFRSNPAGFALDNLGPEASAYLARSDAVQDTPIARLLAMNPAAVQLYREHDIDLTREPLEVAVCAQHNNGGLAANRWWESVNLKHLFPVGEVNGSHGVYRPGGAALNAGQVGGFRLAEYIAARYGGWTLDAEACSRELLNATTGLMSWADRSQGATRTWQTERIELQARMTRAGAHIRSADLLAAAVREARAQWRRVDTEGCRHAAGELADALTTRQLCFAHLAYLEAVAFAMAGGVGSRGSALVLQSDGEPVHQTLGAAWRMQPEDELFRDQVLETEGQADGSVTSRWVPRRPIPPTDAWFETAWAAWREGALYEKD